MPERGADGQARIRSYYRETSWRGSPGRDLLRAELRDVVERVVSRRFEHAGEITLCDVGCGAGDDLRRWQALGVPAAQLFGTELISARAEAARRTLPGASIIEVDGFQIPFPDRSFDVVSASLVLSSILDSEGRNALLREMRRVARTDGVIAVYDFVVRKPWNRNVAAVRRSELVSALGPVTAEHRLGPFLPALEIALALPRGLGAAAIRLLPRTHRLWVWERAA